MSAVRFQHVDKSFAGGTKVLDDVCLQIEAGEFVVFVGPSGSGKSTLLRLLAGLDDPSGGEIHVGGRAAHLLPPSQRGIAMVFQSYALYPHMSVRDNLGFALRMAGQGRDAVAERVERTARSLQIEHLLDRKPQALSGGQRQRVAIGRAIVREPQVFLFDEPLSNLDAALRQSMRVELARLHQSLGTTMIYVTHDQVEAMTLADRIVVFDGGRVQQVGTPAQLYRAPANLFVAGFLGAQAINRLPARLVAQRPGLAEVFVEGLGTLPVVADAGGMADGAALTLAVRPEHLGLQRQSDTGADAVRVRLVEYLGDHLLIYLDLPGRLEPLCAKVSGHQSSVAAGDAVRLQLPAEECLLFDAAGQALPRMPTQHGGQA